MVLKVGKGEGVKREGRESRKKSKLGSTRQ